MQKVFKFGKGLLRHRDSCISHPVGSRSLILVPLDCSGNYPDNLLKQKWPRLKEEYRRWFSNKSKFVPGQIQSIQVQSDIAVVHLLVEQPQDLEACFKQVVKLAQYDKNTLHIVEDVCSAELLTQYFVDHGLDVTTYSKTAQK